MKFLNVFEIFRRDSWSGELTAMIGEMLELAHGMFDYTAGVLFDGAPDTDPQGNIFTPDKRINNLERTIRRRVATRLSVTDSKGEVPSALIFMNVVKDAERLGDYVKNLHEIVDMMPKDVDRALYRERLASATTAVGAMFDETRLAFETSDEERAGRVIKIAKQEGRAHEDLIRKLTASDLRTADAVCMVLTLRFYKRLVSHMSNISTSIVMPVDMMDFYDESENG